MRKYSKLVAFITVVAIMGSMLSTVVSAAFMGRQSTPLAGAVADTPSEYLFEYDGKKFIMLDKEEKGGKKYFFILCEETYGNQIFDTAPDRNADTCLAYWEPADEYNIAYWLNNEFLENGNGSGKALPEGIIQYIDADREWSTEEMKGLEGYEAEPNKTVHPLAILSATEWLKYYKKIGQNVAGNWWLRSARTLDTGLVNMVLCTGSGYTVGTNSAWRANGNAIGVRPCFYLSEDFFKEQKLTSAGKTVQEEVVGILNTELYTEDELMACMSAPEAYNVNISGEFIVGETVTVEHEYSGIYPSAGADYTWYVIDENGDYSVIERAKSKSLVLTEEEADKYIKVSVVPKCDAPFVKKGPEATCEMSYGPVYGSAAVEIALADVQNADVDNIVSKIKEWNELFKVNTNLKKLGVDKSNEKKFATIFSNMENNSLSAVRINYYRAAALVRLNLETNKSKISERLKDEDFSLDTTRYEKLDDTSEVDEAVFAKDFTKYSDFAEAYFKTLAVLDINANDRSEIKELLLYYAPYFDKDLFSVSTYQLGIIGTEILKQTYADFDELNDAISRLASTTAGEQKPIQQVEPGLRDKNEAMGFINDGIPTIAYRVENGLAIEQEDSTEIPFTDIEEASWASESIMYLYDRGIISGYGDGTVKPTKALLREEFVKMVVDAFVEDATDEPAEFTDVNEDAWFAPYINRAVSKSLISGIGDGNFGVGVTVTRQDMAAILYRLLTNTDDVDTKTFNDDEQISSYAKEAVGKMSALGLINGYEDGTFNPNAEATRAMAAKVIHDMLVYIGK